jgi:GLPGLI family protein
MFKEKIIIKKMRKKYTIAILFLFCLLQQSDAQKAMRITYERHYSWLNVSSKFPWMTSEQIDRERLSWGKFDDWKEPYELTSVDNKIVFTRKEVENSDGYSWLEDEYILTKDIALNTTADYRTLLGKDYLIEDIIPKYKWKILNEIKEIQDYLCMKAETTDPIKGTKVTAWFTDKIKLNAGPEGYYGLPGLILSLTLNENDVDIEATKIEIDDNIKLPTLKKIKAKKIARVEFEAKYKKYIAECLEGKRNPYWNIRY